jgi:hypothetical protein
MNTPEANKKDEAMQELYGVVAMLAGIKTMADAAFEKSAGSGDSWAISELAAAAHRAADKAVGLLTL